jgi:hypothetical protein
MHLLEIFLPLADKSGSPFPKSIYDAVEKELTDKFGGMTAYPRAPASGVWKKGGREELDELIVYEVMSKDVDFEWWRSYRKKLENDFEQDRILIRSHQLEIL